MCARCGIHCLILINRIGYGREWQLRVIAMAVDGLGTPVTRSPPSNECQDSMDIMAQIQEACTRISPQRRASHLWLGVIMERKQPGHTTVMTSSIGNIFRITGPLCRWIPLTRASDTEVWCFLLVWWFGTPSRSLCRHCNDRWAREYTYTSLSIFHCIYRGEVL